jgi:hypothetical protein
MRKSRIIAVSAFHAFAFSAIDSFVVLVFRDGEGDHPLVILLESRDESVVELIIHEWAGQHESHVLRHPVSVPEELTDDFEVLRE